MDDLLPNDGSYYQLDQPEEQKKAESQEEGKVRAARPMLLEIVEHFNERIDFYNSVDSIPADVRKNPEQFMHRVEANNLTRDNLRQEKEYLEGLLEQYQ